MLARDNISDLLRRRAGPCVSLFMPIDRAAGTQQNQGRLERLLRRVQRELAAQGTRDGDAAKLARQTESLRDRPIVARSATDGLACFMAPDFLRVEQVPLAVKPEYHIGPRFALRPILRVLAENERFFVLALSHDVGRMFEATADAMCEVPLDPRQGPAPAVPRGTTPSRLAGGLVPPVRAAGPGWSEAALRRRWGGAAPTTRSCRIPLSHPAASPSEKVDIVRFLRAVDHSVHCLLGGQDAPLVLACIGFLAGLYTSVNSYRRLLPVKVPGNPATWSEDQLHVRACQIAEPYLRRSRDLACQKYEDARGTPLASDDVREVVPAADLGRIDTLRVTRSAVCRGGYDPYERRVQLNCRDDDLAEIAVVATLLHGGRVYDVDRDHAPGRHALAAVYREKRGRSAL
jgi:hypothetical protein